MTRSVRSSLLVTHRVLDLAALGIAFLMAAAMTSPGSVQTVSRSVLARESHVFLSLAVLLISWSVCLSSLWLYRSKRLANWREELVEVLKAVSLCTLILSTAELILQWQTVHRWVLVSFWGLASVLLFLVRLVKKYILHQFRLHGRNLRRVVIIGTGRRAQQLAEMIRNHSELGYRLVGFIDNVEQPGVIGPLHRMAEILRDNVVDEMMIALPIKTFYEEMETIVQVGAEQGITVRLHSDLFSVRLTRAVAEQLDETPILSLYTSPEHGWGFICKRLIDFAGAAVLLLLLSPLLLLIAALVKLTSPGPIFFTQERLGYNKRLFRIYKFRTMVVNAPQLQAQLEHLNEVGGPVFKIKDDPRVTPLGRFLRKTSLDELPQLFNVLLGDLSLVGPRPLPRRDYDRFDEYWFNRRFSVKPGITCIWQVSGRSNTNFDHWIRQDLEYIDQWSLALDLKILLKTIPAVLRGTGAM
ncbi:MAG: sugar transferase [Blastocatellia bacterium]|nr:sugar transferase [Blastocatellia bacterium]